MNTALASMKKTDLADPKDFLSGSMRVGGALVAVLAGFLLVKNLSFGIGDDIFCVLSLGIGAFAFVASWLPSREA